MLGRNHFSVRVHPTSLGEPRGCFKTTMKAREVRMRKQQLFLDICRRTHDRIGALHGLSTPFADRAPSLHDGPSSPVYQRNLDPKEACLALNTCHQACALQVPFAPLLRCPTDRQEVPARCQEVLRPGQAKGEPCGLPSRTSGLLAGLLETCEMWFLLPALTMY